RPGLKAQHVGILTLLQQMTGSRVEGLALGATEIAFHPGAPRGGTYAYDVGTAGSLPLFLQTLLPVALTTPGRTQLELVGGTDVPGGPTIDWFEHVYLRRLAPLADHIVFQVER